MAAKKGSGKRTLVTGRGGRRYVTRDSKGRFKTVVSVKKSLAADRRSKAKKTVKPGYGHRGDQKKR